MRKVVREEITNSRPMVEPRLLDTKQAGHYIGRPEAIVRKLAREKRRPSAASSGGRTQTCFTAIGSWTNSMFPMSAGRRRGTWSHSKETGNGKTKKSNERH